MHMEKITGAIKTAMSHLENSIEALEKSHIDDKVVADSLWLASTEIEYVLFLFSLMYSDESESLSWKRNPQPKQVVEAKSTMVSAMGLLKEAEKNMESGSSLEAYEKAWTARNLLLKVTELFEKKRKTAAAQPATR